MKDRNNDYLTFSVYAGVEHNFLSILIEPISQICVEKIAHVMLLDYFCFLRGKII